VTTATEKADRSRVEQLLGRAPRGEFTVVVRDDEGDPVVIRNAPLLDDGTPMPTRYWLVGPEAVQAVSRLEAAGGVRDAEAAVDPAALAVAHARYAAERDAALPYEYRGPAPSGGVGGTRVGVKCLHAHYAWYLAGGDDPVGRWVSERIGDAARAGANLHAVGDDASQPLSIAISPTRVDVSLGDGLAATLEVGPTTLADGPLAGHDPPRPEQLTNALGEVSDRFEDVLLAHPDLALVDDVAFTGADAVALARLEAGVDDPALPARLARADLEEVFRTVATESADQRRHNPGLPGDHVATIVASCCIVVAVVRRLNLAEITVE